MGNWRELFSGDRYVQVIVIQRWPSSKFDCICIYYIDNGKNDFTLFKSKNSSNPVYNFVVYKREKLIKLKFTHK